MLSVNNHCRPLAAAVVMTMIHPWLAAPLRAQAEPNQRMYGVTEYRDKAKADFEAKNIQAAKENSRLGLEAFGKLPSADRANQSALETQLKTLAADIKEADKFVENRTKTVKNLTDDSHLDKAKVALDQLAAYAKDSRYVAVKGTYDMKRADYETTLSKARSDFQNGSKKEAHNGFKRAKSLNKDLDLSAEVGGSDGCYAGCKTAIWLVVLAAGAAGGYFGWKEYDKNKKK